METFLSRIKDGKARFCSRQCRESYYNSSQQRAARFWAKVDIRDADDCWEWKASKMDSNYGQFRITTGVMDLAHRVAYQLTYGALPEGYCVLHACDNPPCCNPVHLFAGTTLDNNRDKVAKGRQRRGEQTPIAKLTERQVQEIRRSYAAKEIDTVRLATQYHVSNQLISMIVRRKIWQHVK